MGTDNYQLSDFNFQLIRVAIVDDHTMVAEGFERIINTSGLAGVIGKAYSIAGCLTMLAQSEADVLLLDVSLPDGNGIDLFMQIKSLYPDLKVVMLTSHSELHIIKRALDCGVAGFIMKNAAAEVIIEGIRTVTSGERFLCEETQRLLKKRNYQTILLSRREQELLRLIVAGKKNMEIADSLNLGYETIKGYRKNLMFKLNASNTAELVRMAIEQHLV
jgi:DNA-binding NarL/FixJ family response regulator